jgi:hypothetical protein
MITDTNQELCIRAIPMFLLEIIVKNIINKGRNDFMGIQINTQLCDIEYQKQDLSAHYVVCQSCFYKNGKKYFSFNEGDIIIEIDNKKFNNEKLIWSETMNMYVPLNTYMMIRSNVGPDIPICVKIAKQFSDDIKIRNYNLSCICYDDMFKKRIISRCYNWKGYIFLELSEEMIIFYQKLNMIIVNGTEFSDAYYLNDDRQVILLNYKKIILNGIKESDYKSFPIPLTLKNKKNCYFFYTVNTIGQRKINNIEELISVLEMIPFQKQKKTILKLSCDNRDNDELMSIKITI